MIFITQGHYTEGAEMVDSIMDVVRKEAESCDCLQVWLEWSTTFVSECALCLLGLFSYSLFMH